MTWPGVLGRALAVMAVTTVLTLTGWTVLPLAWGWQAYTVTSGSMAPLVQPGDVVVASPEFDPDELVGSVVVISPAAAGREPVTHRVVERLPDGRFRTRGDANAQPDARLVSADELIGSGRVVVPLAGLVRLHAGRVLPALAGLALIGFVLTRHRKRQPPKPPPGKKAEPDDSERATDQRRTPQPARFSAALPVRLRKTRLRKTRPGKGRRGLIVAAVLLLAVGSALRDTSATWTATSVTPANTWKATYFYTAAIKKANPVSYWRMGGTSTTAVADEMGKNPLSLYNTPVVGAAGAVAADPNTSTTFKNGTGPSYGAITHAAYAFTGPMTVMAWTNAAASTNWRLVFKGEAQTGRLNYLLSWSSDKGGSDMRFLVDAGSSRYETRSAWPTDKGWHFVVGVYDGAAIRLYIDGVQVSQLPAGGTLAALPATPLQISENNATSGMSGSVDEVAVWSSALTAAQISQFYALAKQ